MGVEVLHAESAQVGTGNFVASGPGVVPLTVQGAAAQTADLTQWKNSAGTVLASVNSAGWFLSDIYQLAPADGTAYLAGPNIFAGTVTLVLDLNDTLQYVRASNSIGINIGGVLAAQWGALGNNDFSLNAATVLKFMRGAAAQSADLQQWQNSAGTVLSKVNSAGVFSSLNKIYAGTDAGAFQTAAGIYAGTGAPNNANGANGDFYLRSDGGALTTIYQRRAGAWAGIL